MPLAILRFIALLAIGVLRVVAFLAISLLRFVALLTIGALRAVALLAIGFLRVVALMSTIALLRHIIALVMNTVVNTIFFFVSIHDGLGESNFTI